MSRQWIEGSRRQLLSYFGGGAMVVALSGRVAPETMPMPDPELVGELEAAQARIVEMEALLPMQTIFGASVNYSRRPGQTGWTMLDGWKHHVMNVGQPDMIRVFSAEQVFTFRFDALGTPTNPTWAPNSWISFKLPMTRAWTATERTALTNSIKTFPTTGTHIVTLYHEPEDNVANGEFTWAAYVRRQVQFIRAVKAAGKPNVLVAPILMSRWHILDTSPATNPGHLDHLIAAANSTGLLDELRAGWDVIGFDPYNKSSPSPPVTGDRQTAEYWFQPPQIWQLTHFPDARFAIAETGYVATAANVPKRVDWIVRAKAYCGANAVFACCWYDSTMEYDWTLTWLSGTQTTDPQSADAWGVLY
jgi:hypothetical protein